MKKVFILFCLLFTGCYTAKQAAQDDAKKHLNSKGSVLLLTYHYKIISPTENDQMHFEDSAISSQFDITDKEIDFSISNKMNDPIRIIWDNASMGILGESHKIMHNGVKFTDRNNAMTATTVLPNTTLSDLALPTDNVYFDEGYIGTYVSTPSSWKEYPLLISTIKEGTSDTTLLNGLKGDIITLYLPIMDINNKNLGYTFKFKVADITTSKLHGSKKK